MKLKKYLLISILISLSCKSIQRIDEYKAEYLIKKATIQIAQKSKPRITLKLSNDLSYIFIPIMYIPYLIHNPKADVLIKDAYSSIEDNFNTNFAEILKNKNSFFKKLKYQENESTHSLDANLEKIEVIENIRFNGLLPTNYKYSILIKGKVLLTNLKTKEIEFNSFCQVYYPFNNDHLYSLQDIAKEDGSFLKDIITSYINSCNEKLEINGIIDYN
ncbi:hypothetical protein [Leptospira bouyouniensis]|uniref:hypothetical protein n=1 Tax=Leptospira bouyouniensis TaxID=2484911 RepID=UPI00109165B1|nr:hypothetical protein [Leptospira bouyouniensis]TGM88703.1 hypothetical protein EHQ99_00045 [Leptospira bouyouniensis]